jgi:cell division protease FtsH
VAGERQYSEETARTIDREVRKLLADAHIRVRETLSEQRAMLEALAKSLIEKEVVDREALMALLALERA